MTLLTLRAAAIAIACHVAGCTAEPMAAWDAGPAVVHNAGSAAATQPAPDAALPRRPESQQDWVRYCLMRVSCDPVLATSYTATLCANAWATGVDNRSTSPCILPARSCGEVLSCRNLGGPVERCDVEKYVAHCDGLKKVRCSGSHVAADDCNEYGATCEMINGQPQCSVGPCDDERAEGCQRTNRVRCFDGQLMVLPCADGSSCRVDGTGVAACASEQKCDVGSAPRCESTVLVKCENGWENRRDCGAYDWRCQPKTGSTAAACVPTGTRCDVKTFVDRCADASTLEYCESGFLRRIACSELHLGLTRCFVPNVEGAAYCQP